MIFTFSGYWVNLFSRQLEKLMITKHNTKKTTNEFA